MEKYDSEQGDYSIPLQIAVTAETETRHF
jgi:hypothetical protein